MAYLFFLERGALPFDSFLFYLQLPYSAVEIVDRLGDGIHLQAQFGRSLIYKVYGLIGQEPVCYIPMAKVDSGYKGIIFYTHLVVILVLLLKAPQDRNRLAHTGLIYHHHLETALQGFVGLEVFLILVQGCRADGSEFSAGKRRFKNIGGVHSARSLSRTHQGVNLVYEKNNLAVGRNNLLYYALKTLLELALILCSGDERSHIKRVNSFVL